MVIKLRVVQFIKRLLSSRLLGVEYLRVTAPPALGYPIEIDLLDFPKLREQRVDLLHFHTSGHVEHEDGCAILLGLGVVPGSIGSFSVAAVVVRIGSRVSVSVVVATVVAVSPVAVFGVGFVVSVVAGTGAGLFDFLVAVGFDVFIQALVFDFG